MCCEFGPPDINWLGPPPKPPGLNFDLVCDGSNVILQAYDTSPFLSSGRDDIDPTSAISLTTDSSIATEHAFIPSPHTPSTQTVPIINPVTGSDTTIPYANLSTSLELTPILPENEDRNFSILSTVASTVWSEATSVVSTLSTDSGLPDSAAQKQEGSSNGASTVNIIAIVLFSVAALILIVFSIVLWYKRKVLIKENKVKNEVFTEDTQYLDNYRAVGKIWKLPRAALLINRPSNKHHSNHTQSLSVKRQSSPTENTPIYEDTSHMSDASFRSPKLDANRDYGDRRKPAKPGAHAYSEFNTSLDRASSTTSGISSDGDLGSRVFPNVEMRHGNDSFRKPRKQRRRYSGYDSPTDHYDRDQRMLRHNSHHARTLPREPAYAPPNVSPQTLARFRTELCRDHISARKDYTTPRKDYITPRMLEVRPVHSPVTSPRPLPRISVPGDNGGSGYAPNDDQLFEMRYEHQYVNGNQLAGENQYGQYSHAPDGIYEEIPYSGNGILEPLPATLSDSGKPKKKKRRGRKAGERQLREKSVEKRHNIENELRESYA